jgi:hypothetical protein
MSKPDLIPCTARFAFVHLGVQSTEMKPPQLPREIATRQLLIQTKNRAKGPRSKTKSI